MPRSPDPLFRIVINIQIIIKHMYVFYFMYAYDFPYVKAVFKFLKEIWVMLLKWQSSISMFSQFWQYSEYESRNS
jgi:hypothetical protein